MAGKDNLRPVTTSEEARIKGRKGGVASGRARRAKRDMRETFRDLLDMPLKRGATTVFGTLADAEGKNMTVGEAIAMTMLRSAIDGDVRAAEFVRDTSGQRPSQAVEVSVPAREASEAFAAMLDEVSREADGGEG